jgi:hypothetical protein
MVRSWFSFQDDGEADEAGEDEDLLEVAAHGRCRHARIASKRSAPMTTMTVMATMFQNVASPESPIMLASFS